MNKNRVIFGFHAVIARIRYNISSIKKIYVDAARHDERMLNLLRVARTANVCILSVDSRHLFSLVKTHMHQGVVAQVYYFLPKYNLDDLLNQIQGPPLLLILDGITDTHNLGACLRVADAAGVHIVIAPKDHAVGINAIVAKASSGAVETVPYLIVTNLARTMRYLKDRGIFLIGMSDNAKKSLYDNDFTGPIALLFGSENKGIRRLSRITCDTLIHIPMHGFVKNLNVSVASSICLYEVNRQRLKK